MQSKPHSVCDRYVAGGREEHGIDVACAIALARGDLRLSSPILEMPPGRGSLPGVKVVALTAGEVVCVTPEPFPVGRD